MTQETEKQIVSLIEAAKQAGSDVASFVQEQAPELMRQIIAWEITLNSVWFLVQAIISATLFWSGYKLAIHERKKYGEMDAAILLYSLGALVAVFAIMVLCDLLKCIVAPNLVFIEAIKGIL